MKSKVVKVLLAVMLVFSFILSVGCSSGEKEPSSSYPDKPITFVCWSAAGSSLDIFMRQLADAASKDLGQTIVVENKTGGSGTTAMSYVKGLPADGYTLLSTTGSMTFTLADEKIPMKAEDFQMIMTAQAEPSAVAVRTDSPIKTLEDFVKTMKEEPGKLSVGGYAGGGFHNFVFHKMKRVAGFEGEWVPFEGGNQAAMALLGGHIDVAFLTPSTVLGQLESGEVKLLAISTPERSVYFPDVPTFKEQGYDVQEMLWRGIMAKQGIPDDVLQVLNDAFFKAVDTPEFKKYMEETGQEEYRLGPDEMTELVNREITERKAFLSEVAVPN